MTNTEILAILSALAEKLSNPLSAEELKNGWIDKSKESFHSLIIRYIEIITATGGVEALAEESKHIARAMDHWGIRSGNLADEILHVRTVIRKLMEG